VRLKAICVGCSNRFEIPDTRQYYPCPKCGDKRLWKDNEETRRTLENAKVSIFDEPEADNANTD